MRRIGVFLLLAGSTLAGPKYPNCVRDKDKALEIARTRGKLIFLTVIVDHDGENRAVIDNVFRNREFIKISAEFVCVYANNEDQHGKMKFKDPKTGKKFIRCADCPLINCEDHMILAQQWSRAFFPGNTARTPIHFVIDGDEEVVHTIKNGTFEQGFNHVPAKIVVAELKKMLKKHGRGLTERQYKQMKDDLAAAKAAGARDKTALELSKLLKVVALNRKIEGVAFARKRVQEIDGWAKKKFDKIQPLVAEKKWEEALEQLTAIKTNYDGTLTAGLAAKQADELLKRRDVKRLIKAKGIYEKALDYKAKGKTDLAKKKLEQCVRQGKGTKYADLAAKALAELGGSG